MSAGIDYGVERFEAGQRQTAMLRGVATLLEQEGGPDGSIVKADAVDTIRTYQELTRTDDEQLVLEQAANVIDRENHEPVLQVAFVADVLRRAAHVIADHCGVTGPVPILYLGEGGEDRG